jgi:GNAT superfamily N-acetyltransferase
MERETIAVNIKSNDLGAVIRELETKAWLDFFAAAPAPTFQHLGISAMRSAHCGLLACRAVPAVPFNRAFAVSPSWQQNASEVRSTLEWLQGHAAPGYVVQIDSENLEAASAELLRSNFRKTGRGWMKFASTLDQAPPEPPGFDIRLVTDERSAQDFARVVQLGMSLPADTRSWFVALAKRDHWHAYILYLEDQAAAAAAMFQDKATAWLGIDVTLPPHRGLGIQRALIGRRLHDHGSGFAMAETGLPAHTYQAADASYRNYQRAGFLEAYPSMNFALLPQRC